MRRERAATLSAGAAGTGLRLIDVIDLAASPSLQWFYSRHCCCYYPGCDLGRLRIPSREERGRASQSRIHSVYFCTARCSLLGNIPFLAGAGSTASSVILIRSELPPSQNAFVPACVLGGQAATVRARPLGSQRTRRGHAGRQGEQGPAPAGGPQAGLAPDRASLPRPPQRRGDQGPARWLAQRCPARPSLEGWCGQPRL